MRKKSPIKPLPEGFKEGCIVKITSPVNFRGIKVGFLLGHCTKNDGGLMVYAPNDWYCINIERGDTIIRVS